MSQLDERRRQRAAAGSRRKRDREAVDTSPAAHRFVVALSWAAEHLPDEIPDFAAASYLTISGLANHTPTPDEVRARLKEQGRDKATLVSTGEGEH